MRRGLIFVLHGATGDLAARMVLPALAELDARELLPPDWFLIGSARHDLDAGAFVERFAEHAPHARRTSRQLRERIVFAAGDVAGDGAGPLVDAVARARGVVGADALLVHYLAVPPQGFGPLTEAIGRLGLGTDARVVFEKPYGTSLESFRRLDRTVHDVLDEDQVFRIDHFLGKEATRNLSMVRFGNRLFSGAWDRHSVRAVQIDVPETLGVADRAGFYDGTGAVLDMLVTHLFQVAAEVAMEAPPDLEPSSITAAREQVLRRFRALDPAEAVIGQFDGYRTLDGVRRGSRTATFVAATLWIDTPRWRGVPFLLRTGKRMHESGQAVSLILRDPGPPLGGRAGAEVVRFALDGSGRVELQIVTKAPGAGSEPTSSTIELALAEAADDVPLSAYARLIHDVLLDAPVTVTRPGGLTHAWRAVAPLLDLQRPPRPYAPGSWGPPAASRLAAPDGWLLGDPVTGRGTTSRG